MLEYMTIPPTIIMAERFPITPNKLEPMTDPMPIVTTAESVDSTPHVETIPRVEVTSVDTLIPSNDARSETITSKVDIPLEDRQLTPKEWLFIECYLSNGWNKAQAVRDAGYKCKSDESFRSKGYTLAGDPRIKRAIDIRQAELRTSMRARTEVNREYILEKLRTLAEMAMSREVIKVEGKTIALYQPNASVRAWELIGKEVDGMFVDRTADVSDSLRERESQLAILKQAQAIVDREAKSKEMAPFTKVDP